MQGGLVTTKLSVRPTVCLSVGQTRDLWQNERNLWPHSYTTWKIIYSSFMTWRMVGGGDPFYLKYWVNRSPLERNRRFWTDRLPVFARSTSAVTPSERSSVNNTKSTTRFLMSYWYWRWSSYVAVAPKLPPAKGGSKTQNGRLRFKIALCLIWITEMQFYSKKGNFSSRGNDVHLRFIF